MPITSVDDIASGLNSAQVRNFLKLFNAARSSGAFVSGWLASGFPGAGVASPVYTAESGYACSSATAGALNYTNASLQNFLAKASAVSSQTGTLIIADRLWSCSGMGFAASTYTVTTPGSLPARITDNGVGVEAWVENFVAAGAATGTLTLNYLNTLGQAKQGVISTVVSAPATAQLQPIPLQAGDLGISQVVSAVNSATWTSGSFGITLTKRIAEIPLAVAGAGNILDWAQCALAKIPNDACIMFIYQAYNTSAATINGSLSVIDK